MRKKSGSHFCLLQARHERQSAWTQLYNFGKHYSTKNRAWPQLYNFGTDDSIKNQARPQLHNPAHMIPQKRTWRQVQTYAHMIPWKHRPWPQSVNFGNTWLHQKLDHDYNCATLYIGNRQKPNIARACKQEHPKTKRCGPSSTIIIINCRGLSETSNYITITTERPDAI